MFEQIFKNVDDVLWKDAGCGSELDYVEQTSWILFLKYIDDLEKGVPTQKVWYYQLNPGRNLGKTNPLNEKDLAEFVELQKSKADSVNSWTVNVSDINADTYDLSVKNPNKKEEAPLREPQVILNEIAMLDEESEGILTNIRRLL